LPAIVLFGPLLFPVAKAVGVNDVHYAMVVILAMGIGLFAPPLRDRLFQCLCDRPHQSRRLPVADLALHRSAGYLAVDHRRDPVVVDWVSVAIIASLGLMLSRAMIPVPSGCGYGWRSEDAMATGLMIPTRPGAVVH
jgi:Tripartite ATP-independent periplasmic transporter, DctM component